MTLLNKDYWDQRYKEDKTGWDIGEVSPPLQQYFDQLDKKDIKILIPGAGNAYEASYLYRNGFKNIHVLDIAPTALSNFINANPGFPESHCHQGDFFIHNLQYDLIIEQTFFCALNPLLRKNYVKKVSELLYPQGHLIGLLFKINFDLQSPPFGGSLSEYKLLFEALFEIEILEECYNSIQPRKGTELFIKMKKKP